MGPEAARIRQTAEQLILFVESGIGQLTHIDASAKMATQQPLPKGASQDIAALYTILRQIGDFEQLPDLAQQAKHVMGLGKLDMSYWKNRENT